MTGVPAVDLISAIRRSNEDQSNFPGLGCGFTVPEPKMCWFW
ncbi:hypothetical protein [Micromonospora sp. ATA51]|nr:hypothetical protein [Micromonospora sp. ATA51]